MGNGEKIQRHPDVDTALTLDDVAEGVHYVTYIPDEEVVQRGVLLESPTYDEQDPRWRAAAQVAGTIIDVWLYDAGITPDGTGETWTNTVTIVDDAES